MKKSINLLLWFSIVTITAFTQTRSISVEDAQGIANKNAVIKWGNVSPTEPIIYYSVDDKIVAYRFNYAINKSFPDKNTVLQECNEGKQNGNRKAQWGNGNYSNILMSARTDLPVNLEYGLGLSSEYAYNEYLKEQAEAHLGLNYTLERIYYVNAVNVWHHYTNGSKDIYVKAHAPSKVGDYEVFQEAISEFNFFCKTGDYNEQWDQYLYGEKSMSKGEHFIVYHDECCPFYDWSYGCSPTAAAMLFGYWDNMSMYSNWNFSKLVDYHFERSDPVEGDIDTHCPNVMAQLAIAMDTDLSDGTTQREDIAPAYNSVAANNGYYFDVEFHTGGLPGLWIYEVVEEIDNDKPVHVSISGHSVLAVGYNDDLDVATHYTHQPEIVWISFLQVQAVYPTNPIGPDDLGIELIKPDGDQNYYGTGSGETMYAGDVYEITWDYDPSPGSYVSLYYHTEHGFGTSWELITSNTPNDGVYNWVIPTSIDSEACRIKINVYKSDGTYSGSDGSYGDFEISSGGSIYTLFNDSKVTTITTPDYYQFSNPYNTWCAVGVRPNSANENWNISMFSSSTFTNELVSSTTSDPVDFVVMDRHHTSSFSRGIKAYPFYGIDDACVEFEGDQETLSIGTNGSYSWQAGDVVEMYDVYLTPGVYSFDLDLASGSGDLDFGLFGSTDGIYYKNKEAFLARSTNDGSAVDEYFTFAVTTSDYYGLCVWANDYSSSSFTIDIHDPDPGTWEGDNSIYWGDANNWSFGTLPDAATDVTIPAGTLFDCNLFYGSTTCNSLTVSSGAVFNIDGNSLTINTDMNINGSIAMIQNNSYINVYGDINWNAGSTLDVTAISSYINAYGDWNFNAGANVNPTLGFVDFEGTSTNYIRCYSDNCSFYNLRNYKSGVAVLGLSALSNDQLVVNNLTYLNEGSIFNSYSTPGILMRGSFNYYGTFDFNTGSVTFDGTDIQQIGAGSGTFNNVIINSPSGSTHLINGDMTVSGDLTIVYGSFNPDTNTVFVAGDWINNTGLDFDTGTGKVVFNGSIGDQYCSDETFNILEIDKSAGNFKVENTDVECAAYDWTEGGVDVTNGSFTANDLLDNAIQGGYYLNTGGTINLTNSGSGLYVDLKGDIHIYGGTMNVSGSISEWPYQEDASIEMSGGVLDFTSCGIIISDNAYALTDNITGGTIRTSVGFSGNRADFTPTAGVFEFYGSADAYLAQSNGNTLHNVIIDKGAKSNDIYQPENPGEKADRIDITKGDGSKANNITLTSNLVTSNDFSINGGVFNAATFDMYVGGNWINDVGVSGFAPSTGTVIFTGANHTQIVSASEHFYNVTIDKASSALFLDSYGTIDIENDFTINTGNYYPHENTVSVSGNLAINDGGSFNLVANGMLLLGDGSILNVNNGGELNITGNPSYYSTISHISSGYYSFNINSGGTIGAEYTFFEYMDNNGVDVTVAGVVNPTEAFNNCYFGVSASGWGTKLMINNDQDLTISGANFSQSSGTSRNAWKYSGSTGSLTFIGALGDFAGPEYEQDPNDAIFWDAMDITINLKTMLEGPFNGVYMNTDNYNAGLIPLSQPYNVSPWNYPGTESVASIPTGVTDWVLIELRDATTVSGANIASIVGTRAAFILEDGSIVDLDGSSPIIFNTSYNNGIYAVVRHINHLGIISNYKLSRIGGVYTYDFSSSAYQAYGGLDAQVQLSFSPVTWGMMAGDGDGNGEIEAQDIINIWNIQAAEWGYKTGDFNMDGQVDNRDKNDYWVPNFGASSSIPE